MTRDLRQYARQTNVRVAAGAISLLFVIGIGLIWAIYGPGAAMMGLLCLLGALVPIGLVVFSLLLLGWIQKRADRN